MNRNQQATRVFTLLLLFAATVVLIISCYMIGVQLSPDPQPSLPADTVIHTTTSTTPTASQPETPTTSTTTTTTAAPLTAPTLPSTSPTTSTVVLPVRSEERDYGRKECSGKLTVTVDSANVRSDADKNAQLVAVICYGETYEVISQKCSSTGILWFEIRIGDTTGYVAGSYVRYDGKIVDGKVYLTFDDGPSSNTRRILDILDQYGVKATFFVIHHSGQDDTYKEIVERGHTIALHSYTHNYSNIYSGASAFFDDLDKLDTHVYNLTGVHSKIIRFPGGTSNTVSRKYCKGVMTDISAKASQRGYLYYDWDVDSGDADDVTVPEKDIINNIKWGMGNRRYAIILMHDAKAKTTTADALPEIIEYLQGKGFEILPITERTPEVHQTVNN